MNRNITNGLNIEKYNIDNLIDDRYNNIVDKKLDIGLDRNDDITSSYPIIIDSHHHIQQETLFASALNLNNKKKDLTKLISETTQFDILFNDKVNAQIDFSEEIPGPITGLNKVFIKDLGFFDFENKNIPLIHSDYYSGQLLYPFGQHTSQFTDIHKDDNEPYTRYIGSNKGIFLIVLNLSYYKVGGYDESGINAGQFNVINDSITNNYNIPQDENPSIFTGQKNVLEYSYSIINLQIMNWENIPLQTTVSNNEDFYDNSVLRFHTVSPFFDLKDLHCSNVDSSSFLNIKNYYYKNNITNINSKKIVLGFIDNQNISNQMQYCLPSITEKQNNFTPIKPYFYKNFKEDISKDYCVCDYMNKSNGIIKELNSGGSAYEVSKRELSEEEQSYFINGFRITNKDGSFLICLDAYERKKLLPFEEDDKNKMFSFEFFLNLSLILYFDNTDSIEYNDISQERDYYTNSNYLHSNFRVVPYKGVKNPDRFGVTKNNNFKFTKYYNPYHLYSGDLFCLGISFVFSGVEWKDSDSRRFAFKKEILKSEYLDLSKNEKNISSGNDIFFIMPGKEKIEKDKILYDIDKTDIKIEIKDERSESEKIFKAGVIGTFSSITLNECSLYNANLVFLNDRNIYWEPANYGGFSTTKYEGDMGFYFKLNQCFLINNSNVTYNQFYTGIFAYDFFGLPKTDFNIEYQTDKIVNWEYYHTNQKIKQLENIVYERTKIGEICYFPTVNTPENFLKLDGAIYSSSDSSVYKNLFDWAIANSKCIYSGVDRVISAGNYFSGDVRRVFDRLCSIDNLEDAMYGFVIDEDGNRFRVPNFQGVFIRVLDEGGGVFPGGWRDELLYYNGDNFRRHSHYIAGDRGGSSNLRSVFVQGTGRGDENANGFQTEEQGWPETAPKSISVCAYIRYK